MDAFYASVELLRYPQLQDLPLVIGGRSTANQQQLLAQYGSSSAIPVAAFTRLKSYQGRGVITTANYHARAFGVGSAMGLMKAAKLCPQAILLPADFVQYRRLSAQFKAIICATAPIMENRGIDEVYIDLSDLPNGQLEGGRVLAQQLQNAITAATGLSCSIGVAPNKLLAKMASEFNKPHGISIVHAEDVQHLIWPLPVAKINGIGPKTQQRLAALNILTIADLAQADLALLQSEFGQRSALWLHQSAWGQDDRPVETDSEPVSMSRESTFERDMHARSDRSELSQIFTNLCQRVAQDLQRQGYVGRTIGIKIRYADFKIVTRDISIDQATDQADTIRRIAGLALKRVDLQPRFRLLGVRVAKLSRRTDAPQPQQQQLDM